MEILSILLVLFLGVLAGIITGLIPGIHINLISSFVLFYAGVLLEIFSLEHLIIFIISMGVIHTFIDFIPSVLFGVPSADTALSLLPGHRLVLKGEAYKAMFLSGLGSFSGMIFAFLISPIFYVGLDSIYSTIKPFIPYLLCITLFSLVLFEPNNRNRVWAFILVCFSGSLGVLTLNSTTLTYPLLILFTGIFGISTLLYSLKDEQDIPKQHFSIDFKRDKEFYKAISVGGLSSAVCSISPGIGNAQAGTISALFFKNISAEIFILVLSSINTINFILSFLTFSLLGRARNGSVFVISQLTESISFSDLIFYFVVMLVVSCIGFFLIMRIGKFCIRKISSIDIKKLNIGIIVFLVILIGFLSGWFGLLVLIPTTAIGIFAQIIGVRRVHLMAVLLVPVILNLI